MKIPWQGPRDSYLRVSPPDVPMHLRNVPGVRIHRGRWQVPCNLAGLADIQAHRVGAPLSQAELDKRLAAGGWRAPFSLLPHQNRLVMRAAQRVGMSLYSPTGSGKTAAACADMVVNRKGPMIVCTRAAAIPTWVREIESCTPFKAIPLRGLLPARMNGANEAAAEILSRRAVGVTAWETIHPGKHGDFFHGWGGWIHTHFPRRAVYLDESHYAKNPKRWIRTVMEDGTVQWDPRETRSAAALLLTRGAAARLLVTATPVANRLHDLWAQLDLAEPWCWGNAHDFGMAYCEGIHNGYGWEYKGRTNGGQLRARLAYSALGVQRDEYAHHLPPIRFETVRIAKAQQDDPKTVPREVRAAMRSKDNERIAEALVMEAAIRKTTVTVQRVDEALRSGQKVVVFTGRRREVGRIAAAARKACPQSKVWEAHGGYTPDQRHVMGQEYLNHPGPCLLVATGHSMGESINEIKDTDLALLVMLPWTPVHLVQWLGRFQRLGGTRNCLVSFLIAVGTYDEDVQAALLDKLDDVIEAVGDGDAETFSNALATKLSTKDAMNRLDAWLDDLGV